MFSQLGRRNKTPEIISKLSQWFISHVTTTETETSLFQPLMKKFLNYLKVSQSYFDSIKRVAEYS